MDTEPKSGDDGLRDIVFKLLGVMKAADDILNYKQSSKEVSVSEEEDYSEEDSGETQYYSDPDPYGTPYGSPSDSPSGFGALSPSGFSPIPSDDESEESGEEVVDWDWLSNRDLFPRRSPEPETFEPLSELESGEEEVDTGEEESGLEEGEAIEGQTEPLSLEQIAMIMQAERPPPIDVGDLPPSLEMESGGWSLEDKPGLETMMESPDIPSENDEEDDDEEDEEDEEGGLEDYMWEELGTGGSPALPSGPPPKSVSQKGITPEEQERRRRQQAYQYAAQTGNLGQMLGMSISPETLERATEHPSLKTVTQSRGLGEGIVDPFEGLTDADWDEEEITDYGQFEYPMTVGAKFHRAFASAQIRASGRAKDVAEFERLVENLQGAILETIMSIAIYERQGGKHRALEDLKQRLMEYLDISSSSGEGKGENCLLPRGQTNPEKNLWSIFFGRPKD